ncbi:MULTISPECIES: cytochrome-c peroxidase [Methylomonas]|uniref:Cytochrome c domain-containing protein n=1 Tax=Methylomonas koyamae TaxID=702114 RepID=A0A177NJ41_9GAMM|nr:cytochrome c peroxidase [Methylomonas koyamae]OAI17997.1 hypothetical protein A1355_06645 [Methylomonas koyamae]
MYRHLFSARTIEPAAHSRAARIFLNTALITSLLAGAGVSANTTIVQAPADARSFGLESLRLAVRQDGGAPLPEGLDRFVKNREAALQLGKALFWDSQIGSDGVQACASCHFHAGADSRAKNQLNPDFLAVADTRANPIDGYANANKINAAGFEIKGPNARLTRQDFPFVKTIDSVAQGANHAIDPSTGNSNDIAGSMGMLYTFFDHVNPGLAVDSGAPVKDPVWNLLGKKNVRRSVPRNAPSVINAVFNFSNFWDGRANPHFNGQDGFGDQNPNAAIVVNTPEGLALEQISLAQASLASQAMDPTVSFAEMSFGDPRQKSTTDPSLPNGRSFPEIGKKLLAASAASGKPLTPLGQQVVHPEDSVLGGLAKAPYRGLDTTYADLIKAAFNDQYWESDEAIEAPGIVFNQMEYNFSLFFGLAVSLYESTLVADRSYFDVWMETGRFNAGFGDKELAGLNLFVNQGQCVQCHAGPELTKASIRAANQGKNLIRPMTMADGGALYDSGFYNIAVTPTTDDLGRGGSDNANLPLAFARQALMQRRNFEANQALPAGEPRKPDPIPFPILGNDAIPALSEDGNSAVCTDANHNQVCDPDEILNRDFKRAAVDGAFKTPGLRNSQLTGPYFHNGGVATLRQVVQFYNRGGNFCHFNAPDLAPNIKPLGLTDLQEEELVAFLVSLTDQRVRYQKAPFDHPELRLPIDGRPYQPLARIGAVGASGSHHPLPTFLDLDPNDAILTPTGSCVLE